VHAKRGGHDDPAEPILTVTDSAGVKTQIRSEAGLGFAPANFGVGRIDPDNPDPQVFLTTYTGGAHCCVHIQLLERLDGRWRITQVGTYDGEPFEDFPKDVDGDGVIDIVHYDDRFAYEFGCYACSWMPPRIFNVRKGKVVDVSAERRYGKLFEADYARAKDACGTPTEADSNVGYCVGVVADGMRLGRADEAWSFALDHLKIDDDYTFPGCKVELKPREECPAGSWYAGASDFRPALTKYLAAKGYVPAPR
jgi:hypothetical protein